MHVAEAEVPALLLLPAGTVAINFTLTAYHDGLRDQRHHEA
jgi:hypothetical protein